MKRFPSLQLLSFWLFPVWLEAQLAPATLRIPAENGSMQELRVDGGRGLRESADGTVAEAWPLRRQRVPYGLPLPSDTFFSVESFTPASPFQWPCIGHPNASSHIRINLLEAWTRSTGAGIRIGIVDDGVALDHPDLAADTALDRDWNDATPDDASPVIPATHGTACAGLATAKRNNRFAIAGVAPDAIPVGLRLTAAAVTDAQEAEAMAWRNDVIHIKSNSWGPPDYPRSLDGPGPLTLAAIEDAVTSGRGGKGTVFVWAAGNGGAEDCSNYNGYANSFRGIAVSSSNMSDYPATSAESGSNVLLCVSVEGAPYPTTSLPLLGEASGSLWGSSGACPIVAGTVALMLEQNPALGYRDVQEILIRSARRVETWVPPWPANGAGLRFYPQFGAGMLDALAAVELAGRWENLPPDTTVSLTSGGAALPIPDHHPAGAVRSFDFTTQPALRVEHVQVTVNATHARRGQLVWELTSPSGMVSLLADKRPGDAEVDLTNWTFSSVCHWGESSTGVWSVKARDDANQPDAPPGSLGAVTVILQGAPLTAPVAAPVLEGPFTADARMEEAFCYFIKGSHRPASFAATGLPPGFSVDAATGQIKGRPTATGTWTVNLSASNSMGTGAGTLTLTVLTPQLRPPVVTSAASARGIRTSPFFYRLTSAAATSVSVSNLPAGLTFSNTTRLITGTPAAAGTFTATLSATNADGTLTAPLEIIVDEPATTPLVAALDLPGATWTTTGIGGWHSTAALTHDGTDAAAIRVEEINSYAGMTTTVQGPGELAFWYYWLRPGESGDGTLTVYGGVGQPFGWIAANTWHQRRLLLTPGPHVIEFRVTRYNESASPATWLVDEVQFLPPVSIGEAVEQPAAIFTSDGTWQGQTAENFDGQDAAVVLARGTSSTSWLETTLNGPGELFFRWKSANISNAFSLKVNGQTVNSAGYEWGGGSHILGSGAHTVRWERSEPPGTAVNTPLGWLDQVQVLPVLTLAEGLDTPGRVWNTSGVAGWVAQRAWSADGEDAVRSPQVTAPQTTSLTTQVTGPAEVQFSWQGGGIDTARVDGAVQRKRFHNSWKREPLYVPAGTHTVEFHDEGWQLLVDQFTVLPAGTLADAMDTPATVTAPAAGGWYPQSMVTHDGSDAATACAMPSGQRSEMTAQFQGAGVLSFWWKYESRETWNSLEVWVDGVQHSAASPFVGVGWTRVEIVLGNGPHTITWALAPHPLVPTAALNSLAWVDEVSFTAVSPLEDGVDTPGQTWTDVGNVGFYTQPAISHDGADAVQAGSVPVDQSAGLASEFTGPGLLTFWWKVNSGFGNPFRMTLDGYEQTAISAVADWNQRSVVVGPGTHSAVWLFERTQLSNVAGGDSAWLDEVAFTPGAVLTVAEAVDMEAQPFGFTGGMWAGQTAESFDAVDAAASPTAPVNSTMFTGFQGPGLLRWRWRTNGTANQTALFLNGALSYLNATSSWQERTFELDSGPQTIGWQLNSNETGKQLWVDDIRYTGDSGITLAAALDAGGITWNTAGVAAWFGQTATTWDGTDAAKSPRLAAPNGTADLSASITGPALISFRWKCRFDTAGDSLALSVDGQERETLTGTQDWSARTIVIEAGTHTLRWRVTRSNYLEAWNGRAWLDTLAIEPLPPPGFGDGIDQPGLTWNTAGTAQWFAQSAEGCDGTDVVTSPVLTQGQTAEFFASVSGPATVSFYAKLSDASSSRQFRMLVDGVEAIYRPYEFDWTPLRVLIPAGPHELRWSLTRPSSGQPDHPQGRAWVDRLEITPAVEPPLGEALNAPQLAWSSTGAGWFPQSLYSVDGVAAGAVAGSGQQADLLASVTGPGTLSYTLPGVSDAAPAAVTFRVNNLSTPAVAAATRTLHLPPGAQVLNWRVNGLAGTRREVAVDQVSFAPSATSTLADAADFAGAWSATAGSAGPWFGQTGITRDGADAMQSPVPSGNSPSTLTLTLPVTGPGVLSFWSKGGGESSSAIALSVNGTFDRYLTGSPIWKETLLNLAAGPHTVSWRPDTSLWDAVWVDSVVFKPSTTVPVADALDGGPALSASTATGTWIGQTGISHDGTDAVQSPLPNTGEAKLSATVNGPAVITYWYRWPSGSTYDNDGFVVWVDTKIWEIHAPAPDWKQGLIIVESGTHTVEWRTRDNKGLLWLDEFTVQATPAATFTNALDQASLTWSTSGTPAWRAVGSVAGHDDFAVTPLLTGGEFITLAASPVQGPGTLQFRWRRQRNTQDQNFELGAGETLATCNVHTWEQRTVLLPPGSTPLHWNYSVFSPVSQQEHRAWLDGVSFVPDPPVSLGEAADTALPLTPSPDAGMWTGYQSPQAADGSDCVFVSNVPANGSASLSVVLTGPGYLSFSAALGEYFRSTDLLRFDLDGTIRGSASQPGWQTFGYEVPAGTHTIGWTYLRGNAGTNSACAKLDRISWQPGVTLSGAANSGATSFGSTAWAPLPLAGASHDLVIASPLLAVGRDARLTTTLSGAGTLSFSWYREATASPPSLTLSRNSTQVSSLGFSGVWQRTSVILAPGTHNLEWRAAIQSGAPSDTGRCFIDDISFIQTGTTGYNTWAAGFFSPAQLADINISGPLADPDLDGQANLNELGFGGNPLTAGELPTGEWITTGGIRAYCFRRLPAYTAIVTLTPQFSTDLSTWRDAVSQVVFNDGTLEYLRAFIPADEGQIFFRVKATLTP